MISIDSSSSLELPTIHTLNSATNEAFTEAISILFEPAKPLSDFLYANRPFKSYTHLFEKAQSHFPHFTYDDKIKVLNAHPVIGAPKKSLSEHSLSEQGGGEDDDQDVLLRLEQLNLAYEDKFGFRFVVFVNGRAKKSIVPVLEERLGNEKEDEMNTAFIEMMNIAKDRFSKMLVL
jgi:OHCU decarboxylase